MPKRLAPDILNSQLMATIERQRRIICDLLIKNEEMRMRLKNPRSNASHSPERESMSRRFEPGKQISRLVEVRPPGSNDLQLARTAQ